MKSIIYYFIGTFDRWTLRCSTKVTISGWPGNPVEEGTIKQAVDTFNTTVGKQKGIEVV